MYHEVLAVEEEDQTHPATRSRGTDVVPPLENAKAALPPVNELSFYTSIKVTHGYIAQL